MEKIYEIRECKQDILRSKLNAEILLNELRRWDKEDFEKHSPTYLEKMGHELRDLAKAIRETQKNDIIFNRAVTVSEAMMDYAYEERRNNNEQD